MKNTLYSLLLVGAFFSTSVLATAATNDTPAVAARAKTLTRQIADKTRLSEGQYVKVKQLNLRMLSEVENVKKQLAADPAALDQRLAEVQDHYEWDLAAILWPRQMAVYSEAKASMTALNVR
ncbi:hypothetical protein [Hymenobacter sp. BT491]|uniref:hypothetical protein n=1 Tax=Hymenobacter sp. BT491 TaxID=2766779 RepID=UPI001653C0EB|nr:hypothetical protein [Hymenobacter sp. BT491]MBC6990056.1 hypothetical protein [Hymenobacter sp. BT491]